MRAKPQKIFGTMPFPSKENAPFDIKKALQKGTFVLLLKEVGSRPPGPPSSALDIQQESGNDFQRGEAWSLRFDINLGKNSDTCYLLKKWED